MADPTLIFPIIIIFAGALIAVFLVSPALNRRLAVFQQSWILSLAPLSAFLLLLLFCVSSGLTSEIGDEIEEVITDEEESSSFFKKDWRFVPVPIPISNPTIGTGLVVAGLYLHPRREGQPENQTNISGIVGMYTNTDSWMGAAFHSGSYGRDKYRVSGGLAYGEFNLKFYLKLPLLQSSAK
jgi:hypothetical protein